MKTHTVLIMGSSRVGESSIITRVQSPPPFFFKTNKRYASYDKPRSTATVYSLLGRPSWDRDSRSAIPLHHLERNE
jgi:hypothetical protein